MRVCHDCATSEWVTLVQLAPNIMHNHHSFRIHTYPRICFHGNCVACMVTFSRIWNRMARGKKMRPHSQEYPQSMRTSRPSSAGKSTELAGGNRSNSKYPSAPVAQYHGPDTRVGYNQREGQTLSRVIKSYVHDRSKRKGEVEYSEVAVVVVGTNVEEADKGTTQSYFLTGTLLLANPRE
jgi:hypothetical protein